MTVPASGNILKQGSIAMERLDGTYIDYNVPSKGANVPMFNLYKGGQSAPNTPAGSNYPALASASPGYAALDAAASANANFKMSLWYSYNQDAVSGYTMKRKVEIDDDSGEVSGESVNTTMTLSGGSPSFLNYNYSTTFDANIPFTTTSNIATTNKYTTFSSVGFEYSGTTITSGQFGFGWIMSTVSKSSPSGLNPGPSTGFGGDLDTNDFSVFSSRGGGFNCKASINYSMSYTISSGNTVNFDYDMSIEVF
tara:strand:+ start:860 stop:1615 length:756 start_codon:yes stop_codon:yes gene_type:complete